MSLSKYSFGSLADGDEPAISDTLDIFEKQKVEAGITARNQIIGVAKDLSGKTLDVTLNHNARDYMDTSTLKVHSIFKIQGKQGPTGPWGPITKNNLVAPENLIGKSLFNKVDVTLNNTRISLQAAPAYHMRAYLETICSYGNDAADTHLKASYYVKDDLGKSNAALTATTTGSWKERKDFIVGDNGAKTVHCCDNLHSEITALNKLIPSGVDMHLRFSLNDPELYLHASDTKTADNKYWNYRIVFDRFFVTMDLVTLKENVYNTLENKLAGGQNALYNMIRSTIRTSPFLKDNDYIQWNGAYTGTLPSNVLIGIVDSEAFTGDFKKNPFHFEHANVESLRLQAGTKTYPLTQFETDFPNEQAITAYRHLFDNLCIHNGNLGNQIDYKSFMKGMTLWAFDLTTDLCSHSHAHEQAYGNISLAIKLEKKLEKNMTVFMMSNFKDRFVVTGPEDARQVILNPNSVY